MNTPYLDSLSAGNSYLSADGLANIENIAELRKDIVSYVKTMKPQAVVKKAAGGFAVTIVVPVKQRKEVTTLMAVVKPFATGKIAVAGEAGKFTMSFVCEDKATAEKAVETYGRSAKVVSPIMYYTVPKRSKAVKYSAVKTKAKEPAYMKKRAINISERTSVSEAVTQLLPVYAKGVLSAALEKKMMTAVSALKSHINKVPKVKETAGAQADKNRAVKQKEYAGLAKEVRALLEESGIKAANIVLGTSIAGQTLYVKLASGKVMTVGLSSVENFNKAKKAAAEAYTEDELDDADEKPARRRRS
jgi:hypothetical protein